MNYQKYEFSYIPSNKINKDIIKSFNVNFFNIKYQNLPLSLIFDRIDFLSIEESSLGTFGVTGLSEGKRSFGS